MKTEKTPDGHQFLSGTMGEVHPECYEKQKDDSLRFSCLTHVGKCPHEETCFVALQRAIQKKFNDNPEVMGGKFTWMTDKKRLLTKIKASDMIHTVFQVKDDPFTPVEEKDGKTNKD